MKQRDSKIAKPSCAALRIAGAYAILAGLWIFYSGRVLDALVEDPRKLSTLEVYKGWFFVAVTSIGLYFFIRRQLTRLDREARRARLSENRFNRLFESNVIGIHTSDVESGEIREANDAFLEMIDFQRTDLPLNWKELTPDEWKTNERTRVESLKENNILRPLEKEYIRQDGRKVPVLNGGVRITEEDNILLVFSVDLSDQKEAEEKLRALTNELETRVHKRTIALENAVEKAESADRLKSVFLATMSHELRTPLNSIIGFTSLVRKGLAGPLNAEQVKQLEMSEDSAKHLLSLINDILDISKIEADQLQLYLETFDPGESIQAIMDRISVTAQDKSIELRHRCDRPLSRVNLDRRRFEQILMNLLSNAIKFTDHGYVELAAEHVYDEDAGDRLRIDVVDTGQGIPDDYKSELFKPFSQASNGSNRHHEGTGLGLVICKRLTEAMGGMISVESETGKGSRFRLEFPLDSQASSAKHS